MNKKQIFLKLLSLGIPMMLQSLLSSSLAFFDTLMISRLGDSAVVSVGAAGQLLFIFFLVQFGIHTGLSVHTSQFHGKGDMGKVRELLGIQLLIGMAALSLFMALIYLIPRTFVSLYTDDPDIINSSVSYLKISGLSLFSSALVYAYTYNLRSTGIVRLPLMSSAISVVVNLILNRVLIFGAGPVSPMGVQGAALASAAARVLESVILIYFTYRRKYISAARFSQMFSFSGSFFLSTLKVSWPVFMNEFCWVMGISVYNWVYATLGTSSMAAVNIASSIENLIYTPFFGMFGAGSVIVGNSIGRGKRKDAADSGTVIVGLHFLLALLSGILLFLFRGAILEFYQISGETRFLCSGVLAVMAIVMALRVANYTFNVSVFRGGGDTKFSLFLDFSGIWFIGVPMALIGGLYLKLPVYIVMSFVALEELYKIVLAMKRFRTGRWIRSLV